MTQEELQTFIEYQLQEYGCPDSFLKNEKAKWLKLINQHVKEVIGEDDPVKYKGTGNPRGFKPEVDLANAAINIEKEQQRKRAGIIH